MRAREVSIYEELDGSWLHAYESTMRSVVGPIIVPTRRSRAPWFVLALLFAAVSAQGQTEIRSLTGNIDGHSTGGVTTDLIGNIYVADFGDFVWKITPEGERHVFASGFYGASGNAIDNEDNSCNRISTAIPSPGSIEKVKRRHSSPAA